MLHEDNEFSNSLTWVIGGAQGSGVDSAANIFSRACFQAGFYIFGKREYYSNIKGEHSYFTVRVSEHPIRSHVDGINILVSFDSETIFRHADKVTRGGFIIYDSELGSTTLEEVPSIDEHAAERIKKEIFGKDGSPYSVNGMLGFAKNNGAILYDVPYFQVLRAFSEKVNEPALSKLTRMINVMALALRWPSWALTKKFLPRQLDLCLRQNRKLLRAMCLQQIILMITRGRDLI